MRHPGRDLVDMMGNQHQWRGRDVADQGVEGVDELLSATQIESCRRFVEENDCGVGHQRAGKENPLLLTRRQRSECPCCVVGDVESR